MEKIKDVKKALRHRDWMEQIAECQSSGMSVRDWCKSNGISPNTYYRRLRAVRTELLDSTDIAQQIVPLSVAADICETPVPDALQPAVKNSSDASIVMRKDGIEIELPQSISEDTILVLLRGLRQC